MSANSKGRTDRILNAEEFAAECKQLGYPAWITKPEEILCLHQSIRTDQGAIVCNICGETIAP